MKKAGKMIAWILALAVLFSSMSALAEGSGTITAGVADVDKDGTIRLDVSMADLANAGINPRDIVEVTVGGKTIELPVDTSTRNLMFGQLVLLTNDNYSLLTASLRGFVEAAGLGRPAAGGNGSVWEWADGASQPESVSIRLVKAGGFEPAEIQSIGALNVLNMDEKDFVNYVLLRAVGLFALMHNDSPERMEDNDFRIPAIMKVTTFDTLDAMLMGLSSGQVCMALAGNSVADYICSRNPEIHKHVDTDSEYTAGTLSNLFFSGLTSNYAFMLPENNTALRDEINGVLREMSADGTMQQLVKDYITDAVADQNIHKVEFENFDDAETIRFVVTGDIPPVDYVAEDGTPAGFSTAVLAEIGRRLHRNIQLIVSTNLSRSLELADGNADVAFWTRTHEDIGNLIRNLSKDQLSDLAETTVDRRILELVSVAIPRSTVGSIQFSDIPDGMITTDAYYSEPVAMIH